MRNDVETANAEATEATSSGKLLRRSEAARMLGVSVSTLRRREGEVLNPIVGPDGVHLFDEAEVRAVMVTLRGRAATHALGPSSGDVAAEVFTLLDAGAHAVDIVKQLRLQPDIVISLRDQWSSMRGGFCVGPEEAATLGRLARARPAASAHAAVAHVRARIDNLIKMRQGAASCAVCGDKTASLCEPCSVATRGPLTTCAVRIESRSDESEELVRIAADVCWEDVGSCGGEVATLYSDWVPATAVNESPIWEAFVAIRCRQSVL